ncbi:MULTISPECIES: LCP family protein [Streptomyces]|uniref:Transcriptional regulator n=1 Tax=Streptomyces venezuelae TaxID=54571 RepID=A0A5P2BC11_STRVZ|nr:MULTISPECIES: LCP family protein [Streptomyces]MYY82816.1 LytR family transcriptional regulator [Streptomyces sp. SID335]MYZ16396.1 LytR family transcriptional regulator [Streptomyces sp. SID337]NDZ87912.1 LCP family protein [Streptomyces sp. SID10115]NEB44244.1 LCP family protein [Streptomyces sp. SID339]QES27607.1 transcriptional regulator [Streptomyces venezuelae]
MRQNSVRKEGARRRAPHASDHGWDESRDEGSSESPGEGPSAGPREGRGEGRGEGSRKASREGRGRSAKASKGGGEPPEGSARHRRGARGGARPPRRKRRVLRWSATILSVLILGTAGAGYLYYQHLNGNLETDDLNLGEHRAPEPTPNAAGQTPLNILLIGSDARDSKANQKLGGAKDTFGSPPLADVQMLLHVSADRSNMSVVSMPRDTLLQIPKCTDPDDGKVYPETGPKYMTNESLGRGGPGCTVATWEKLTNIHIDHFMMVDFAGVVSMADAIGGVPVCVDKNIHSRTREGKGSGLKLKKGTTEIQGEQALQWLRTRYGFEGGTDISRAKAQHMYMNALVRKLRENTGLTSPNQLRKLAEEATNALTVDDGLGSPKKLYDLGNELKKVSPSRTTMTTMPFDYAGARVVPKPGDAEQLFRLVRDDVPLDGKGKKKKAKEKVSDDPAAADGEIAVQVQNGTRSTTEPPVSGRASTVAQLLVGKGFKKATPDSSAALAEEKTVVRYPSADLEGDAQRVAKSLGLPLSAAKKSTDVSGVTLIVGADWREGDAPPKAKKKDDSTPESADALSGSDKKACMKVDPNFTW